MILLRWADKELCMAAAGINASILACSHCLFVYPTAELKCEHDASQLCLAMRCCLSRQATDAGMRFIALSCLISCCLSRRQLTVSLSGVSLMMTNVYMTSTRAARLGQKPLQVTASRDPEIVMLTTASNKTAFGFTCSVALHVGAYMRFDSCTSHLCYCLHQEE